MEKIDVPCLVFDGKTGDFAAEMFVIINSTQTRINHSHLVDLLDRIAEKPNIIGQWLETPSSRVFEKVIAGWADLNDSAAPLA